MTTSIRLPSLPSLLIPLVSSFPTSTISPTPPSALLPLLSPILRQRVQFLSSSSTDTSSKTEPWVHLLTYDTTSASRLPQIIASHSQNLEPHPVSGEIELDYSALAGTYLRLDSETLHSFVTLPDLELVVKLTWCVNDQVGGGDGWRISEVLILDSFENPGFTSIEEAEKAFASKSCPTGSATKDWLGPDHTAQMDALTGSGEVSDDEDDYWASYDRTPGRRTPAPMGRSPGPFGGSGGGGMGTGLRMTSMDGQKEDKAAEEEYYARYARVQPAMEKEDPDEKAAMQDLHAIQTRGIDNVSKAENDTPDPSPPSVGWEKVDIPSATSTSAPQHPDLTPSIPGPKSGSSSRGSGNGSGSDTVARLEGQAAEKEQCETSVRRHIGNTIKGLYFLAKGTGMGRKEFEDEVRREVECLGMFDEGEE